MKPNCELLLESALTDELDSFNAFTDETRLVKGVAIYDRAVIESVELNERYVRTLFLKGCVAETVLRDATEKRSLTTLKSTTLGATAAGLSTLVTLAGGTTPTGRLSATDALLFLTLAGIPRKIMNLESHYFTSSTRIK